MCETEILYKNIIKSKIGNTKPSKLYEFPCNCETIKLEGKDLKNFNNLYGSNGENQTIGFGEISLFWLFGGKITPSKKNDLIFNNKKIDVKSYNENGFITIGKWKDNTYGRQIINALFSCYNLVNIGESKNFKSELGFSTNHMRDAIEANLELSKFIKSIKSNDLIHENIKKTLNFLSKEFKKLSSKRNRKFLNNNKKNKDKIINEAISDLIYGLVSHKLFESENSIGENGYIVNVVKDKEGPVGKIQIYNAIGLQTDTKILQENFSVVSGEIKIKPNILLNN